MRRWILYFGIMFIGFIFGTVKDFIAKPDLLTSLILILSFIDLIALWSYIFHKVIMPANFWRPYFIVGIIYAVTSFVMALFQLNNIPADTKYRIGDSMTTIMFYLILLVLMTIWIHGPPLYAIYELSIRPKNSKKK